MKIKKVFLTTLGVIVVVLLMLNSIKITMNKTFLNDEISYKDASSSMSGTIKEYLIASKIYDCKLNMTVKCLDGEMDYQFISNSDMVVADSVSGSDEKKYTIKLGDILDKDISFTLNENAENRIFKGNLKIEAEYKISLFDYIYLLLI